MSERLKETQMETREGEEGLVYSKEKGGREWDRGKVILDDGSVAVQVWGKDTSQ